MAIIALYATVHFALTGLLSRQVLNRTNMAVIAASQVFLPSVLVTFMAAGALLAAATSINGILMGISRDIYKGAKSGMVPAYFGAVHRKFSTPTRAVKVCSLGSMSHALYDVGGEYRRNM